MLQLAELCATDHTSIIPKFRDLEPPIIWHDIMKKAVVIVDQVIDFLLSLGYSFALVSFFNLSCIFIVNFIYFNVFWSSPVHSLWWVSWDKYFTFRFFLMLPVLIALSRCVKILYDTTSLFYEVLCEVFWYRDVLSMYCMENSLVWHWTVPKGARLGRCTLYFLIFTVYNEIFC